MKHPKQSGEVTKLRHENERLRSELADTRLQQSTSAEVLKAISDSSFDLRAVLSTLAESAATLCGCNHAAIYLRDGDGLRGSAFFGASAEEVQRSLDQFLAIDQKTVSGRVILANKPVCIADVSSDAEYDYAPIQKWSDARALLGIPLLRNGKAEGVFSVARRDPGEYSSKQIEILQNFADQAVVAIENARLHDEVRQRNRELEATSDVLRVISSSPTDIQPVFQAIADSAARLCGAQYSFVYRFDGKDVHFVAHHGLPSAIEKEIRQAFPMKPGPASAGARAILSGQIEQVPDVEHDPDYAHGILAKAIRTGSVLAVPMLRNGTPVGAIALDRSQVGPFPERQVELLKTFADQAVIAIENARLFEEVKIRNVELTESLDAKTATSAILRVIATSPNDIQPVLDAVVESAARLCNAYDAIVFLHEGDSLVLKAHHGPIPVSPIEGRRSISREWVSGRVFLDGQLHHVEDLQESKEFPRGRDMARRNGYRTVLSVPLLRERKALGAISLRRLEAHPFNQEQIELLTTFADQAVIAIENVRLFEELQARTQEVSEALQQQTATAEVLKSISSSAFDLDAVLRTLVNSAADLCRASFGIICLRDGRLYRPIQQVGFTPEFFSFMQENPFQVGRGSITGRVGLSGEVIHIPDVLNDPEYTYLLGQKEGRYRTVLGVPLLRNGEVRGAFALGRPEVMPFSSREIELVQTFADQAVIAIENVRLFEEVQTRNRQLTETLEQQTATSTILRAIASSPTDIQPVLDTVAESAAKLCQAFDAVIFLKEGDDLAWKAHYGGIPMDFASRPIGRDWITGRAFVDRKPIHVQDVRNVGTEFPRSHSGRSTFGQSNAAGSASAQK